MGQLNIAKDIIAVYQRHGWKLRRVLLSPSLRDELAQQGDDVFGDAVLLDSEFDALWFARPSQS